MQITILTLLVVGFVFWLLGTTSALEYSAGIDNKSFRNAVWENPGAWIMVAGVVMLAIVVGLIHYLSVLPQG